MFRPPWERRRGEGSKTRPLFDQVPMDYLNPPAWGTPGRLSCE